ncbi:hypothetical protein BJX70DRAFT_167365 [Aspergillus crustosus]
MRPLLLTLDAFNTLFHPRTPIPAQYAAAAANHNIHVSSSSLQPAFRSACKSLSASHPNYGRDLALRGEHAGPRQWWADVIRVSFSRALADSHSNPNSSLNRSPDKGAGAEIPDALVEDLLERFASARGYNLYEDVGPFFEHIRQARFGEREKRKVVIGVVSNSDDRISSVLESLGVSVHDARAGEEKAETNDILPGFEEEREKEKAQSARSRSRSRSHLNTRDRSSPLHGRDRDQEQKDIDFVLTSYQVGAEKPDPLIWDVALQTARRLRSETDVGGDADGPEGWERIHVGDDFGKDYCGATDAGWKAYYLARDAHAAAEVPEGTRTITSLMDILRGLEK